MQLTDTNRPALYYKMDTRTEKLILLHLPAKILSAIIANLPRNEDITFFRLTCRKIGNFAASKASLYRKVDVCVHPRSWKRFELIAFNKTPSRAGGLLNSASQVKDLIFEDVRVAHSDMCFNLSKVGIDLSGRDLTPQLEQFEHQLYYNPSEVDAIGAAAKQLNALETVEYDPGSTRFQRTRGHRPRLSKGDAYINPREGYEEPWQS